MGQDQRGYGGVVARDGRLLPGVGRPALGALEGAEAKAADEIVRQRPVRPDGDSRRGETTLDRSAQGGAAEDLGAVQAAGGPCARLERPRSSCGITNTSPRARAPTGGARTSRAGGSVSNGGGTAGGRGARTRAEPSGGPPRRT